MPGVSAALDPAETRWFDYVAGLSASVPFESQWAAFRGIYTSRPFEAGPPPAWRPGEKELRDSNPARFARALKLDGYEALRAFSQRDRGAFWGAVVEHLGIPFERPARSGSVLEGDAENPRWFPGSRLNITNACFRGNRARLALISGREGEPGLKRMTLPRRLGFGTSRGSPPLSPSSPNGPPSGRSTPTAPSKLAPLRPGGRGRRNSGTPTWPASPGP